MHASPTARARHAAFFGCAAIALAACSATIGPDTITVEFRPRALSLDVGQSTTIVAEIASGRSKPSLERCESDNVAIASVARTGNSCTIQGVAPGTTSIRGTLSTGETAAAQVTVNALPPALIGLQVTPPTLALYVSQSLALDARAQGADSRVQPSVTYRSEAPEVATVSTSGVVTGVASGVADIVVTATGRATGLSETTLTRTVRATVSQCVQALTDVQFALLPTTQPIFPGETRQLVITLIGPLPSAGTFTVSSDNPAVAVVTSTGQVTAVGPGTTTFRVTATVPFTGASCAQSLTRTFAITITALPPAITAFSVSPATPAPLSIGGTVRLVPTTSAPSTAAVRYSYASSQPLVASVAADGLVTAVSPGSTVITATADGSGPGLSPSSISRTVNVTVLDRTPGITAAVLSFSQTEIRVGTTAQASVSTAGPLAATATFAFSSDQPAVASVSSTGVITGHALGSTVIRVRASVARSGQYDSASVTAANTFRVRSGVGSVRILPTTMGLRVNGTAQATATVSGEPGVDGTVTYATRNSVIATVNAAGLVTGVAAGTTRLVATSQADPSVADSITLAVVNPCVTYPIIAFGASINGNIDATSCVGRTEYYGISTNTPLRVRLELLSASSALDVTPLASNGGNWYYPSRTSLNQTLLLAPGVYRAAFSAQSPTTFHFTTTVNPVDACESIFTTTALVNYPLVLNNGCAQASDAGSTYWHRTFYLVPNLMVGENVTVRVAAPFRSRVDLLDVNGSVLASGSAASAGATATMSYTATANTAATIRVSNILQPAVFGTFTFTITGPAFSSLRLPGTPVAKPIMVPVPPPR